MKPIILLVEEDEHIAYLLTYLLAREGYEIVAASDGRQAQALIDAMAERPCLVLLDLVLPYVDGFQLLALIRSKPAWEHIAIVVLSVKSNEKDIARAFEAGASDYIVKPFQPVELKARLRRYLEGDRCAASA